MIKSVQFGFILVVLLALNQNTVNAGAPTVSWYFRGSVAQNLTLTVNTGTTLVLGCLAKSGNNVAARFSPAFAITIGSAPSITASATVSQANAVAAVAAVTAVDGTVITPEVTAQAAVVGSPFVFTSSGGNLVWNSVNGHSAGYDHFVATASVQTISTGPASGFLQLYVPNLKTTDAGTYYCTFYDGSAASSGVSTTYASSTYFQLIVQTFSGSSSPKSVSRNKALEYSLALMGSFNHFFL